MSTVNWGAIENLAARLSAQLEGVDALQALAKDMQATEAYRREAGDRLANVTTLLAQADERLARAHAEEHELRGTVQRLRRERDEAERGAAHRLNVLESGLAEMELAERAEAAARLAEYKAACAEESTRLNAELVELGKRVVQAEKKLAELKGV